MTDKSEYMAKWMIN